MTMIKGSDKRTASCPVDRLFIDRWSPRAMTGEEIRPADLDILFEAARWAPSSHNNQPWRILFARRNTVHWDAFFSLLADSNKVWAQHASVLLLFVSKSTFDHSGGPSVTHSFDAGAAWENLALQGFLLGYVVHGMEGFDYERARTSLGIPPDFSVEMMAAVGRPADAAILPEGLRERETPTPRRPIEETVREGRFSFPVAERR